MIGTRESKHCETGKANEYRSEILEALTFAGGFATAFTGPLGDDVGSFLTVSGTNLLPEGIVADTLLTKDTGSTDRTRCRVFETTGGITSEVGSPGTLKTAFGR